MAVNNNAIINLDTTFSVTGNVAYTHSWKVKTDNGFITVNKEAKVISDSTFFLFIIDVQGCSYTDSVTVRVKGTTDIYEPDIRNLISIYPNPNTGDFRIIISGGYGKYSYEIIDVTGTKTADGIIDCTTEECIFDISLADASPGVYTLVIKKNGVFFGQKKFIVSR